MAQKQIVLAVQTILTLAITEALVLLAVRFGGTGGLPSFGAQAITARLFILAFLISTTLLLFLIRNIRQRIVFEIIFALSIFSGIWFLSALVSPPFALALALGLTGLRYLLPYVAVQNFLLIAGIAGIATALGASLMWTQMAIVLGVLAIYDIIAVYGTRHMVTMFKSLAEKGVIFAFIIPEHPRLLFTRADQVSAGENFFFLGTGDVALPALFVASAAHAGVGLAIGAAVGSLVGLFFTDLLFQWGRRRPMPALPPIALGTLAGFFVAMLMI